MAQGIWVEVRGDVSAGVEEVRDRRGAAYEQLGRRCRHGNPIGDAHTRREVSR